MARDETPEQLVESVLHHYGIANSGDVAEAIVEVLGFCVDEGCPHHGTPHHCETGAAPDPITPTHGAMDDREHMAFILRIFMHYVELTPGKMLTVNLEQVMKTTQGRQMQVRLDGPIFEARTIAGPIVEQKPSLLI